MRLIDADELKKWAIPCEIHSGALTELCVPLYLIDNAPTVEPENLIKPIAEIKCEITEEEKQRLIELLRKEVKKNETN